MHSYLTGGRMNPKPHPSSSWLLRRGRVLMLALLAVLAGPALEAATYEVGAGQTYTTLASLPTLQPGDIVEIHSGTYNEVKRWSDAGTTSAPITIRGVGATRPLIDATGLTVDGGLPNPRACFQLEASNLVISNIEFANARNGDNGSGIRVTSFGATNLNDLVEDCSIHDCDMGIMTDTCDAVTIQGNEVFDNGTAAYSGYSHNFYLGGGTNILIGNYIHDSLYGQNVKSRAHCTELLYNFIADSQDGEIGLVDSADTATANSNALMVGNLIISKNRGSGWNSTRFVQFGEDLGGAHTGTLYAYYNTCIAGTTSINFFWSDIAGANLVISNNIMLGSLEVSPGDLGTLSGQHNWLPTGALDLTGLTGSTFGTDPGFINAAGGDYHLAVSSPARGIAATGLTWLDGAGASQSGTPTEQFESLGTLGARANGGDAGAYGDLTGSGTTTGTGTSTGTATGTGTSTGTSTGTGTGTGTSTGTGTGTGTTTTSGTGTGSGTASGTGTGGFTSSGAGGGGSSSGGCGLGGASAGLLALLGLRRRQRWCSRP